MKSTMHLGHRRYRIRGLSKNLAFDQMKVNMLATTEKGMYVDTFDLYIARHRRQFVIQAAIELGVEEETIKKDLGRVLLKLEELQDEQITQMMKPKEAAPTMTTEEKDEALRLLRRPEPVGADRGRLRRGGRRRRTSWSAISRPSAANWISRWRSSSNRHRLLARPRSWKPSCHLFRQRIR